MSADFCFMKEVPDMKTLSSIPEEKLLKLWEGLGYYSRCKNLIATAKIIDKEYNGKQTSKEVDSKDGNRG